MICTDREIARYVSDTYRQSIKNKIIRNIHVGVHKRIWKNKSVKKTPWPNITMVGHIYNYRDPTNIILAMPAILKFDLLTMALDKFILDVFRETGDGIIIVDNYGNILNINFVNPEFS